MEFKKEHIILFAALAFVLQPISALAIVNVWPTDPPTMEAMQKYHRKVGSLRLTERLTALAAVEAHTAHAKSQDAMEESSKQLDRYIRALDWLDATVMGFQTVLQGYGSYKHITANIKAYSDMVSEYAEQVYNTKGYYFESDDAVMLQYLQAAIPDIQDSFVSMAQPLKDLARIALMKAPATSAQVHLLFEAIQQEMSMLDFKVSTLVGFTYKYLQYKKVRMMRPIISVNYRQMVQSICDNAFITWINSGLQSAQRISEANSFAPPTTKDSDKAGSQTKTK